MRGEQSGQAEHLFGGIGLIQLPYREVGEQERTAQEFHHHRRIAYDILSRHRQPDCHRPKQQGGGLPRLSGFLPADPRLR